MTHRSQRLLVPLCVLALAVAGWVLAPGPFGHGLIVGVFSAPVLIGGSFVLFARNMQKRMATRLQPPPLPVASWDYVLDAVGLDGVPVSFFRG